jgi:hypothetical protein
MADALITEHAGTRRDEISRFYQYGSDGVRVLDPKKTIKRLYLFDPSSDMMTERDPARQEKILRRFVFDRYGMLEETFSFGERPRTFRYENGCMQIAVREGGDYGAVGKIFTFESNGITETAWGRHGEIERVYHFDTGGDVITERAGGWYGEVDRTIVFAGIEASLFLEPEAFLQFLMFTEWSAKDRDEDVKERVAKIRGEERAKSGQSPFAYTGSRHTSADIPEAGGRTIERARVRTSPSLQEDAGIDFIPDGDTPAHDIPRGQVPSSRRSSEISFEERWHHTEGDDGRPSGGKSAEIPLEERFESAHRERENLSPGKSVEIPLEERFESAHRERENLSPGKSVEIPLEERFESAHREREKLSKGKSAKIPYDERRTGGNL